MAPDQDRTASTPECHRIRQRLGAELEEPAADVAEHLARCAACTVEAQRLRAAWRLLGAIETRQPSPQFARRVWAKIAGDRAPGLGSPRNGGLPVWSIRWVAAGLAVVLAAVVPIAVWYQNRHDHPELVAQLDLVEARELLTNLEVVEDLDVLLLVDDP